MAFEPKNLLFFSITVFTGVAATAGSLSLFRENQNNFSEEFDDNYWMSEDSLFQDPLFPVSESLE